ncbi:unnamed protein product [Lactuca saligna]|uniref:Cyclin-like domain-containing protein n=1 Tax=Lactuca saligna TaxID=75948 RepID=A0AA36E9T6_LACSI|nr:unnamed protein product [Lactuca saligna]
MDEFLLCQEVMFDRKNGILEDANDFLLCDEVWDMSPVIEHTRQHHKPKEMNTLVHHITKEDCERSFANCLRKEMKYMLGSGYVNLLECNPFVATCRFKAIQWLIHSHRRFNFCVGTVLNAVNYVDRFIYINKCHGWNYLMMELLSVASLSIAIKFGETSPPSLNEIQEGLEYSFEVKLIQRMELRILESLGWELNSITPHSYVELIVWELNSYFKNHLVLDELSSRLNDLLLASSLDYKFLKYRPCVIVMSGLRCVLEDFLQLTYQDCLSHISNFIPPDQTENLQTCCKMMQETLVRCCKSEANGNPSSPDTVLIKEQVAIFEEQIDLSLIDGSNLQKKKNLVKRKREEDDGCFIKHKKYVD